MGFDELATELHKSAEAEGKKLTNAAEKNAARIVQAAQEKADDGVKAARKEVSAQIKQESSERITSAKLAAKKIVDEARDEAVEAALHDVWKSFKASSLRRGAYQELLNRLVREGLEELGAKDAVVYVRGRIRHPDHQTICLPCWYRVMPNTETEAPAMRHVAFLD